jgi:hypothetical protein
MTFSSRSETSTTRLPQRRVDARLESPVQLAVAGGVLWLIAAVIHPLALLGPLGILLLVLAGLAYVCRPRTRSMYWRGRHIDLEDDSSVAAHVYRLFFRR